VCYDPYFQQIVAATNATGIWPSDRGKGVLGAPLILKFDIVCYIFSK